MGISSSKERDSETGLDYFGARYMSSAQGRFTSVDPVVITTERLNNPQQLNLYAYVANNPLRFIDPRERSCNASGTTTSIGPLATLVIGTRSFFVSKGMCL